MAAVRNSTILHSVEDLSTDSTWLYKTRSGFDSNRGSKKRCKHLNFVFLNRFLTSFSPTETTTLLAPTKYHQNIHLVILKAHYLLIRIEV